MLSECAVPQSTTMHVRLACVIAAAAALAPKALHRRDLLNSAAGVALAVVAPPAYAVDASAARARWKLVTPALGDLLANWAAEKWAVDVGGGDVIREKLGTQGTASSLYQIEKVFKALRDSDYVEDPVAFVEADEEFIAALFRADSLASSSNNKTGSGKQTPPAVFIEQAKAEVVKMQGIAKKMNALVK